MESNESIETWRRERRQLPASWRKIGPMSTLAQAAPTPPRGPDAGVTHWIISRQEDLTWFIGSAAISYLALAWMAAGLPLLPVFMAWLLLVDGPHVLATATRTYFDRQERAKLGWLLWMPLPLLAVGPLIVAAGYSSLFFLFAVCWQHLHIVKQHFGFVMLYKAKHRERDSRDFFLDRWFLLSSLFLPLALYVFRTRPWLSENVPGAALLGGAALTGYLMLAGAWAWRQVEKYRIGAAMNWPKIGLLLTVVPLQWLALLHAAQHGPDGILRAGITLGLFHSFQYHRLLWFHNHNRYRGEEALSRYGPAATGAASSALAYFGVAVALHFFLMYLPVLVFKTEYVASAAWGFSFSHYIIDARIWHVRSDRELAHALQLA